MDSAGLGDEPMVQAVQAPIQPPAQQQPKKKSAKKIIQANAWKADKVVQLVLEYKAMENIEDLDTLDDNLAEAARVSR